MTKFERIQKTVNAAKERARKTSVTLMGGSGFGSASSAAQLRRESRMEQHHLGVGQQPFPARSHSPSALPPLQEDEDNVDGHSKEGGEEGLSEVERSIRARMNRRDGIMRSAIC